MEPAYSLVALAALCAAVGGWRAGARICKRMRCPIGSYDQRTKRGDAMIFIASANNTLLLGAAGLILLQSPFLVVSLVTIGFLLGANVGATQARSDEADYDLEIADATASMAKARQIAYQEFGSEATEGGPSASYLNEAYQSAQREFDRRKEAATQRLYQR
jgi:hypothetical protein